MSNKLTDAFQKAKRLTEARIYEKGAKPFWIREERVFSNHPTLPGLPTPVPADVRAGSPSCLIPDPEIPRVCLVPGVGSPIGLCIDCRHYMPDDLEQC